MERNVLRDEQWERIKDLLPGKVSERGVTAKDNRLFMEAVLWIGRSSAPWRDLPSALGNWYSTFTRFSRWAKAGVWERLFAAVSADRDLEEVMLDSTAVRAHQHAAGAKKKRPTGFGSRSRRVWYQNPRHCRCTRKSHRVHTDRGRTSRHHTGPCAARQGSAGRCGDCRQGPR
jgi:transposase